MNERTILNQAISPLGPEAKARWQEWRPKAQGNAAASGEVLLYGEIIVDEWASMFEEDEWIISGRQFREKLNAVEGDVTVRINSPGGDLWEASAMQNALIERRNAGDTVNVIVDGLAASAATVVMLAAEKIAAAPVSTFMLHQAHILAVGTSDDLFKMAEFLVDMDEVTMKQYAERMGMDLAKVKEMCEEETWMAADEALAIGLIDEVIAVDEGKTEAKKESREAEMFARRNLRLAAIAA